MIPYPLGRVLVGLIAAASGGGGLLAGSGGSDHGRAPAVHPGWSARSAQVPLPRSDTRLLGQRLMVAFDGTRAPASLLRAARDGEIGGVILFGRNLGTGPEIRALTGSLQHAARRGGAPGLLIATDQEGGEVKRLSGPPALAPPQIARTGSSGVARAQGVATGRLLHDDGIDIDLAPVADVPTSPASFMARQGRTFSPSAPLTARLAASFAAGVQSAGVAATGKHFPGIGSALRDTDDVVREQLRPTAAERAAALEPFRALVDDDVDAIMVADAAFPADESGGGSVAALSPPIVDGLLRRTLGFGGLVITDSLGTNTGEGEPAAGLGAARAGADELLFGDRAPGVLAGLRTALDRGELRRADADAAYRRIVALKRTLGVA